MFSNYLQEEVLPPPCKRSGISCLTNINKKLKIYKLKFSRDEFVRQIEEKKGFWKTDLSGLIIGKLPGFDEIFKEIKIAF